VLAPTSGTIHTSGPVTRSLLTLGLGFNRELSGRDNALLSAMLQGYSRKDALAMLPRIQEYSELGDFFGQPVKAYSSGMCSKLGFATAIIVKVDILLIDEVLSVGDSQFKKKAERTMLERVHGEQTVIFVSHQVGQLKKVCRRALWLEGGSIRCEGEVAEVIRRYDSFMQQHRAGAPGAQKHA